MTYLKTISRWVLKKNCVVFGTFKSGSLNIASAGPGNKMSQAINFDIA